MHKTLQHKNLLQNINQLIQQAQTQVVRNVNATMLITYFEIGRMIVEHEQKGKQRAEYAKEILKSISINLGKEFGRGYSVDNLQNMRLFYTVFKKYETAPRISTSKSKHPINETVSRISKNIFQLSWSHYTLLLKIKDENERCFYEIESVYSQLCQSFKLWQSSTTKVQQLLNL